jgi:hypothetical protein
MPCYEVYEVLWRAADARRDADRAFVLARRKSMIRRVSHAVAASFGDGRAKRRQADHIGNFDIRIDDIEGLPSLTRGLAEAWRREYYRYAESGCDEPCELLWKDGSWLLKGGVKEHLRVEIARALGAETILARSVDFTRSALAALPGIVERSGELPCPDRPSCVAG